MRTVKRKAAVFGFSLLFSDIVIMLAGSPAITVLIPAAVVLCAYFILRRHFLYKYLIIVSAAFMISALSLTAAEKFIYAPSLSLQGKDLAVTGTVADYPLASANSVSFTVSDCEIAGCSTPYSILIYCAEAGDIEPGDVLSFTVSELSHNEETGTNFFYHTLSTGCWLRAFCYSGFHKTGHTNRAVYHAILKLRNTVIRKSMLFDNAGGSLIAALLTGEKSFIPDSVLRTFRLSGVSHIFAVSGMHLAIWSGVIFLILRKRARVKLLGNIIASLFVVFYCIFTGLSPSVLRAGIMLLIVYMAALLRKRADPLNSLGIAASLLLLYKPFLAGNVSFLLSFFATFALVGVVPALLPERNPRSSGNKFRKRLFNTGTAVLISLTVIFITLPVSTYFFGYVTILSPAASLLCTPIAEAVMITGAASLLFPVNLLPFTLLHKASLFLSRLIIRLTAWFAELDFAVCPTRKSYIYIWFILTAAALLAVFFLSRKAVRPMMLTALTSAAVILLCGCIDMKANSGKIDVYIPDNGSACCFSVATRNGGRSLVFGCEGDYDTYTDLTNHLHSLAAVKSDLIVVPRKKNKNEKMLTYYTRDLVPEQLLLSDGVSVSYNDGELLHSDSISSPIWENASLDYQSKGDNCAGLLTVNGTRIAFALNTESDPTPFLYEQTADLLICSNRIPDGADSSQYQKIVVMSDKSADKLSLPPNAVTTADLHGVHLVF